MYREALAKVGAIETLFAEFNAYLRQSGYLAMGGQIVDATIVPVPKNRNSRAENATIKQGEMPENWDDKPAMQRQKDLDARWTMKNGQSYYGYRHHVSVDRRHKLRRRYSVTSAARHDSQELAAVLDQANTASDVWADSAYRSVEAEAMLAVMSGSNNLRLRQSGNAP